MEMVKREKEHETKQQGMAVWRKKMMEGKWNLRDRKSGDDGEKVIVSMVGQNRKKVQWG